jgi:hypothetical protein
VQAPHAAGVARPLREQHADDVVAPVGPQPRGAGQPAQGRGVLGGGQQVGAAQLLQLQAVLEQAQEAVGRGEVGAVVAGDVPAVRQRRERLQRRRRAQRLVGAPVHELQELHGELDVAQPAAPQLQLALGDLGLHVLLDAPAHGLHVGDEAVALGRVPHHRRDGLEVGRAQLGVARDRAGLEQRLELPRLGPAPVVGHVAVERADQLALAPLRPQVRVDLEARLPRHPHHPGGELGGGRVGGLGDEHDVDVADVVQLAPAALAHRDDGQTPVAGVGALRERLRGGHRDRGLQRGGGQVGQVRRDLVDLQHGQLRLPHRGEVGGGEDEQLVAVGGAQGLDPGGTGERGPPALGAAGGRGVGVGADGPEQRPRVGRRVGRAVAGEAVPAVGVGDEVVGERRRAAEQAEQPPPEPGGRPGARRRTRDGRAARRRGARRCAGRGPGRGCAPATTSPAPRPRRAGRPPTSRAR